MSPLWRLTGLCVWLSFLAFGGAIGVVPEMEKQVVTVQGWLTPREFVDGYALSQLTPGPNMLVTVFIGYRVAGLWGALLGTAAMFGPVALLTGLVGARWHRWRRRPWGLAAERALAPVGLGLMTAGVFTLARAALTGPRAGVLAGAAAGVLATRKVPPVVVVLAAGAAGWALGL